MQLLFNQHSYHNTSTACLDMAPFENLRVYICTTKHLKFRIFEIVILCQKRQVQKIFSEHFSTELDVVDIQTQRIDRFGKQQ